MKIRATAAIMECLLEQEVDNVFGSLVMGMAMPVMSTSWKASLPRVCSVTLQVMKTMGEESM